MAQEEQKNELQKKMKKLLCVRSEFWIYMFSRMERRNILARQLRGNKSSLWGYEMSKARDHQLHPRLENKDYEDLVPRFPSRSWDDSNKENYSK